MRGALAADAQRAAGAVPTAQPFTRTTRTAVPTPPLRLGIACDVSGSMVEFAGPVASAAWILAHAARHTRVDTTTAAVIFGEHVRADRAAPATPPAQVTEFRATDNYEAGRRGDRRPRRRPGPVPARRGPAAGHRLRRILARAPPRRPSPDRPAAPAADAACCGWPPPTGTSPPATAPTSLALSDPAATARAIGRAATTALRAAH